MKRGRGARWEPLLFTCLLLIHLAPLASVTYLPTDDGPAHVGSAYTLLHYQDPAYAAFRQYFEINGKPVPNWLGQLLLAALLSLFAPATALKIVAGLSIALLPLSARYALGAVRADAQPLAALTFPFTYNLLFHKGFLNFCLGLPLFFLAVGWWWRRRERPTLGSWGVLALLLLAAYACHLVVVAVTGLVLLLLALTDRSPGVAGPRLRSRLRGVALAGLPPLVLAVGFVSQGDGDPGYTLPITTRLLQLATAYSLVSFERRELPLAAGVALVFAGAALYAVLRRRHSPPTGPWFWAVAVLVVLYFASPDHLGSGTHVVERLNLFVYFTALLWLAARSLSPAARRTMAAAAVLLSAGMLVSHAAKYQELAAYIEESLAVAPAVEPNSTLLSAVFSYPGETADGRPLSRRVFPFSNLAGWIAAERGVVDLRNYQGWMGYFPLLFREELNPLVKLSRVASGIYLTPPAVDLRGYAERTSGAVDYVLVWNTRPENLTSQSAADLFRQLEQDYELVAVSRRRGYSRLYRARSAMEVQPSKAGTPSR